MYDVRIFSTDMALAAMREGAKLGLNRQVDVDGITPLIDPDGWHAGVVILPFHSAFDKSLPSHHRIELMVKVKGSMDPIQLVMDITVDTWQRALEPSQVIAAMTT